MICHRLSGDRSGLAFEPDWPDPPPPQAGEVTVAVAHAALNYPDLLMLSGGYQFAPTLPFIPGVEGSGTVIAIGSGVDPALIGRPVIVGAREGLLAEFATVPATTVRPVPAGLTRPAAAAFTVAALTAYVALVRRGRIARGEHVLVAGAGGGTGLAAVALATALGASVTALVSSAAKADAARVAGATDVRIAARGAVVDLTTVDLVFDPVGGDLTRPLLAALRRRGRYLVIGFVGGIATVSASEIAAREIEVIGVRAGEFARRDPAGGIANLAAIDAMAARLVPHIGVRITLDNAAAAFTAMADGALIGKAVIDCLSRTGG